MLTWPWREQPNDSVMFPFCLPPQVPLALLDPPWSNSLLWGSWVVRRILVHQAIVLLISVPCRARGSAAVVRRILVISPEFSHHDRRVVLVFARVQMCGQFSLVHSIKCTCREIGWIYGHLFSRRPFLSPDATSISGPIWLSPWWPSALWGSGLPSIQGSLSGLIVGQCKPFVSIPRYL